MSGAPALLCAPAKAGAQSGPLALRRGTNCEWCAGVVSVLLRKAGAQSGPLPSQGVHTVSGAPALLRAPAKAAAQAVPLPSQGYINSSSPGLSPLDLCRLSLKVGAWRTGVGVTNKLFYGDNLDVLREHIAERERRPHLSRPAVQFERQLQHPVQVARPATAPDAQIEAFEDTWHWNDKRRGRLRRGDRSGNTAAARDAARDARLPRRERHDGLSGDDGGAADRAAPRAEADRQPLPALRPDREPLSQDVARCGVWAGAISATRSSGGGTSAHNDAKAKWPRSRHDLSSTRSRRIYVEHRIKPSTRQI